MTFRKFIALLFISVFLLTACLAQKPSLSDATCQEFWDQFNGAAKEKNKESQTRIMTEIKSLWDYELSEFKKIHPDLPTTKLEALGGSSYYVMFVYTACEMRQENLSRKVHDNMQKVLYRIANHDKQSAIAEQNGCKVYNPKSMAIFDSTQDGTLYPCGPTNFEKARYSTGKNEAGKRSIKFCTFLDGIEQCQFIEPTRENVCLGEFGVCTKDAAGKCGWAHTSQSQSCMKY